jgi:8-hydroxy-5-deazaflavin:NADPH oxidoreductase
MKIGIFGGGMVAQSLGTKLSANGHEVMIGIRKPDAAALDQPRNGAASLKEWVTATKAKVAGLPDAARHGEILINATSGGGSIEALTTAGAAHLAGKLLIDAGNPLDFSRGAPWLLPEYSVTTSLAEEIQKAFPEVKLVKAFNTMSHALMINPASVQAPHDLMLSGNDAAAKETVKAFATREFGWQSFIDLGDLTGARAQEAYLIVWMQLWKATGTHLINIHLAK